MFRNVTIMNLVPKIIDEIVIFIILFETCSNQISLLRVHLHQQSKPMKKAFCYFKADCKPNQIYLDLHTILLLRQVTVTKCCITSIQRWAQITLCQKRSAECTVEFFLISEAQRNFRNELFDSVEAQRNSAPAERHFRTKLKRNLTSAIEISQLNANTAFFAILGQKEYIICKRPTFIEITIEMEQNYVQCAELR